MRERMYYQSPRPRGAGWVNAIAIPVLMILLASCGQVGAPVALETQPPQPQATIDFPHIHGMGFSADGQQLIVAAHSGLRIFADGRWSIPPVPAHDYMGYSPFDAGFYSSGHPQTPGMVNPFGLIKSVDGGKTLQQLGFEGESDFHIMGVGYTSHAIYVFNYAQNSKLTPGLHFSLDDGATWQPSAMQGLTAQPTAIAVHPTDVQYIAIATTSGLFISRDAGATFLLIGEPHETLASAFSPDGTTLYFGGAQLFSYTLTDQQVKTLQTPLIPPNDGIAAIAINPIRSSEIAFATYGRDLYLSKDGSTSWSQLVRLGKAESL